MAQFRWHNAARAVFILCVMLFGFMGVAQAGQAKYVILLIGDGSDGMVPPEQSG